MPVAAAKEAMTSSERQQPILDPTKCPYDAVVFDAGGVVLESPFLAIAALEKRLGLPPGTTNNVIREAGAEVRQRSAIQQ